MRRMHIPEAWRLSAETIARERLRVILVLGGSDSGKSSYCRFLVTELLAAGNRVAIVDADVGQKDLGPPATITLGYAAGSAEHWAATPNEFYLVGSTNPVGRMLPLVVGTARLVSAADAPFVVIDTTGYVEGAGRVLKGYKIEAVRPDLIVAIEQHDELEAILRSHRTYRTIRIRPSRKARIREQWERDEARMKAFATYFKEARRLSLELDQLIVQRSLIFTGEPFTLEGALYAERTVEGVVAVAESALLGVEITKRLKPSFERNLLCGVADACNRGAGLAILESIAFDRRTVQLVSPVPPEKVRVLQVGDLYVDLDGRELGRVGREGL